MLVYSNTKANDEVGLYYYDPATETPEQATRIKLIENIQNGLSPYFMQMVDDGQWDAPSTTGGFHVWANGVQKIKNNMFAVKMDPTYYFGLYVTNHDTMKTYYTNVNLNAKKDEPLAAIVGITDDAFSKQNEDLNYVFGLSDDDNPGCELIFTISKLFDFNDIVLEFTLDGPYTSAKDVKIHVYRQDSWMELTAPKGGAASKIAVPADFVWPDERVSLKTVYPDFPRYAIDDIDAEWWKNIR